MFNNCNICQIKSRKEIELPELKTSRTRETFRFYESWTLSASNLKLLTKIIQVLTCDVQHNLHWQMYNHY